MAVRGAVRALLFALLFALLSAGSARADSLDLPIVIEGDGFVVRAEGGLDSLARTVAGKAPAALARIREDFATLPRPKLVDIRLVKRARDIRRAAPPGRGAPEWAAGVSYPYLGVVVVATRRESHSIDVSSTLVHELAHVAMGAALGGRAPRWLDEGFAYLHSSDWSFERAQTLTGMVWFGNVIPLGDIDDSFPAEEQAAERAYAQSYDFVGYLARRGRYVDRADDGDRWPFRAFLAEIARGATADQAAWEAYGAHLDELYQEWYVDLRDRYLMMPAALFAVAVWVIGAFILILAYIRRRRQTKRRLAEMQEEEDRFAAAGQLADDELADEALNWDG